MLPSACRQSRQAVDEIRISSNAVGNDSRSFVQVLEKQDLFARIRYPKSAVSGYRLE